MGLKHVEGAIGALRLRQWMRVAGVKEFWVGAYPAGHYRSGELYIELFAKDDERRDIEESVLLNLRKAGLYTGEITFIPAAKICVLRFGIRVKPDTKIALFGRHRLYKVDE